MVGSTCLECISGVIVEMKDYTCDMTPHSRSTYYFNCVGCLCSVLLFFVCSSLAANPVIPNPEIPLGGVENNTQDEPLLDPSNEQLELLI